MDEKLQLAKEVLEQMFRIADHYRRLCSEYESKIADLEKDIRDKDEIMNQYLKSILVSAGNAETNSRSVVDKNAEVAAMMEQLLNKSNKEKKSEKKQKEKKRDAEVCVEKESGDEEHETEKQEQTDLKSVLDTPHADGGQESKIVRWREE